MSNVPLKVPSHVLSSDEDELVLGRSHASSEYLLSEVESAGWGHNITSIPHSSFTGNLVENKGECLLNDGADMDYESRPGLPCAPQDGKAFLLSCFPHIAPDTIDQLLKQGGDIGNIVDFLLPFLNDSDGLSELGTEYQDDVNWTNNSYEPSPDKFTYSGSTEGQEMVYDLECMKLTKSNESLLQDIPLDSMLQYTNTRTDLVSDDNVGSIDGSSFSSCTEEVSDNEISVSRIGLHSEVAFDVPISSNESLEESRTGNNEPHIVQDPHCSIVTSENTCTFAKEEFSEKFDEDLMNLCSMFSDVALSDLSLALSNANGNVNEAVDAVLAEQFGASLPSENSNILCVGREGSFTTRHTLKAPSALRKSFPLASADVLASLYAECGYSVTAALEVAQQHFNQEKGMVIENGLIVRKDNNRSVKKSNNKYVPSQYLEQRISIAKTARLGPSVSVWDTKRTASLIEHYQAHLSTVQHSEIAQNVMTDVFDQHGHHCNTTMLQVRLSQNRAAFASSNEHQERLSRGEAFSAQVPQSATKKSSAKARNGGENANGFLEIRRRKDRSQSPAIVPETSSIMSLNVVENVSNSIDYTELREPANVLLEERAMYFRRAAEAFKRKQFQLAFYYSQEGRYLTVRIQKAQGKAAREIFRRNNPNFPRISSVDLHGLHVIEAVQLVKSVVSAKDPRRSMRIITGMGTHSTCGAKLRPSIKNFLQQNGYDFVEEHGGQLLVLPAKV
eukprot:CFRG0419T1